MSVHPDTGVVLPEDVELPEELMRAAAAFNDRHQTHSKAARAVLVTIPTARHPPHTSHVSLSKELDFTSKVNEVRRNRLWVPDDYEAPEPPPPRQHFGGERAETKWSLDESIWHPRKLSGNSRDYWETPEALTKLMCLDWHMASQSHSLEKHLLRQDSRGVDWVDENSNDVHDALDEVTDLLCHRAHLIYSVFDYYAALGDDVPDAHGEMTVFSIEFNAWLEFCRNCKLTSKAFPASMVELVWVQVNALEATGGKNKPIDRFNHSRHVVRHEWIEALMRIALSTYVQTKQETSAAIALQRLLDDIESRAPIEALQDSNAFRRQHCYVEAVDVELRRERATLAALFKVYSGLNANFGNSDGLQGGDLHSTRMMSVGEWLDFCNHLGLLESGQLTLFGAKMTFLWSRIRSAADYSAASERRLRNLFFEDFLEALVRLACCLALPTDAEIHASGADDAGSFLLAMREQPEVLASFIETHKVGWHGAPRQPAERCVAHLISFVVRNIEEHLVSLDAGRARADLALSVHEVQHFEKLRRQGGSLSQLSRPAALLDGVQASASLVRRKLLEALHRVELFANLDYSQIETLSDAMVEASVARDEAVCEQGDEGATLYVLLEGTASVTHEESPTEPPALLATLGPGSHFGERGLLQPQTHYATVRATSERLVLMSLPRTALGAALGATLEQRAPSQYRIDLDWVRRQLASLHPFDRLSARHVEELLTRLTQSDHVKGSYLAREGHPSDAFHFILAGEAEGLRGGGPDGPTIIDYLTVGGAFGSATLLDAKGGAPMGVRAASAVLTTLTLSREAFEAVVGPDAIALLTAPEDAPVTPASSKRHSTPKRDRSRRHSSSRRVSRASVGSTLGLTDEGHPNLSPQPSRLSAQSSRMSLQSSKRESFSSSSTPARSPHDHTPLSRSLRSTKEEQGLM